MKTVQDIIAEIGLEIKKQEVIFTNPYESFENKSDARVIAGYFDRLKSFILSEPECEHTPDNLGLGHCSKCGRAL